MKLAVCLCFALVVVVSGERCTVNSDCSSGSTTSCVSGTHVVCEHSHEIGVSTNGGFCTCAKDDFSCTDRDDCKTSNMQCIDDNHKHCYDGKCICTRW